MLLHQIGLKLYHKGSLVAWIRGLFESISIIYYRSYFQCLYDWNYYYDFLKNNTNFSRTHLTKTKPTTWHQIARAWGANWVWHSKWSSITADLASGTQRFPLIWVGIIILVTKPVWNLTLKWFYQRNPQVRRNKRRIVLTVIKGTTSLLVHK